MDKILQTIVEDLQSRFDCHTVILYGSRARGDWNEASDYDVMGISDTAERVMRHAYPLSGSFVDGFVYPSHLLEHPDSSHIYMHDGKVLVEREHFGADVLSAISKIYEKGPTSHADELQMKRIWYKKMLARAQRGDLEGNYRKHWLIYSLPEDYFAFRGRWYEGPKKAFASMARHDLETLKLFEAAFATPTDLRKLEVLVEAVVR